MKYLIGLLILVALSSCHTTTDLKYQEFEYNIRHYANLSKRTHVQTGFFRDSIRFGEMVIYEKENKFHSDKYVGVFKNHKCQCVSITKCKET